MTPNTYMQSACVYPKGRLGFLWAPKIHFTLAASFHLIRIKPFKGASFPREYLEVDFGSIADPSIDLSGGVEDLGSGDFHVKKREGSLRSTYRNARRNTASSTSTQNLNRLRSPPAPISILRQATYNNFATLSSIHHTASVLISRLGWFWDSGFLVLKN